MLPLILLFLTPVVYSFVVPLKLSDVANQTEQAETLTQTKNFWTTTVKIGTPGTAFTVAVDVSTSFLFVPDVSSSWKDTYDETKSSTYNDTGFKYWSNSVFGGTKGEIGQDTVIVCLSTIFPYTHMYTSHTCTRTLAHAHTHADQDHISITVPNAFFGHSTLLPPSLPVGIDGVLGLAFPPRAPAGTIPVFQSAINQQDVASGIFVIWLEDQWATSDNGTHGVIYYGNNDNLHCKVNQRHVYPLSAAEMFQFTMSSFSLSSPTGNYTFKTKSQATVSSTSQFIGVPTTIIGNVLTALGIDPSSTLPVAVPCNTKIDLGFNFPLGTEHVSELNLLLKQPDGSCVLAINDVNDEGWQSFELGIPFLRGRCTYFDVSNQKIGFSEPVTHGSEH